MGWVLGWATPEAWFAPFVRTTFPAAQHEHVFVPAAPDAIERLEASGRFDWVTGYSLGSLLLLSAAERSSQLGRVALLAPILAFPREKNMGGRVSVTQVRQLARWLRREPDAALADFYRRAGLDVPAEQIVAAPSADLRWGLERLEQAEVKPDLPAGWRGWCGAEDALLDAARLHELVPEIEVVPGATHHPAALLRVFAGVAT